MIIPGEDIGRLPTGELAQANTVGEFTLGEHVRVQVEVSETGTDWRSVRHVFDGTVVGGPCFPEGEDPGPLTNIMPDDPYPPGSRLTTQHPRYFLMEPFWVVDGQESTAANGMLLCRYAVTRVEALKHDTQAP